MQDVGGKKQGESMTKQHCDEIKKLNFGLTELTAPHGHQVEMSLNKPEIHCTQLFRAASCTIAKRWKPPKCPSMNERGLSIQRDIIQLLKRKEILAHAIIWMNLEDILLSDMSQTQKDSYYMIPLL